MYKYRKIQFVLLFSRIPYIPNSPTDESISKWVIEIPGIVVGICSMYIRMSEKDFIEKDLDWCFQSKVNPIEYFGKSLVVKSIYL